jgi:hypothetical protein
MEGGMFGEMLDASLLARRSYYRRLAGLSLVERLAMMGKSSAMTREMAAAGIRRESPGASNEELRLRVAVRLYGRETVERILGSVPEGAR